MESRYSATGQFTFLDEINIGHTLALILPCTYLGQWVEDQWLFYTPTRLTATDMLKVCSVWLEDQGALLIDIAQLKTTWKQPPTQRKLTVKTKYITVSWGEKLGQIARLYLLDTKDLLTLNRDVALRGGQVQVGEKIKIAELEVTDMYQLATSFEEVNLSNDMLFQIEDYKNLPLGFTHYAEKDLFLGLPFLKISTLDSSKLKKKGENTNAIYHLPHAKNNR